MGSTETAPDTVTPVEASPDPVQETPAARSGLRSSKALGVQWAWSLVEFRGEPYEPGRTDQRVC